MAAAAPLPGAAHAQRCPGVLRRPAVVLQAPRPCGFSMRRTAPQIAHAARPGFVTFSTPGDGPARRGSGSAGFSGNSPSSTSTSAAAGGAEAAKPPPKPRLPALDSLRFFFIAYIAVGHFIAFATREPFLLRLFAQVNVWVGAFFVLSGYVAAYVSTELGAYKASSRVQPEAAYTISRIAGFYPLFILVQLLFAPMFIFADAIYNGPIATAVHGLMSCTLVQAWFPAHAEVWNAPTWFLSALAFSLVALPYALPAIARLRRRGLAAAAVALTVASLLPKLAYSYDLGAWTLMEGMLAPRAHPNLMLWNVTRFNPFYCLIEVLMGAVACRWVMVSTMEDDGSPRPAPAPGSALLPLVGLLAITAARAAGWLTLNDPLTRCLLFVPLFTAGLMALHANSVQGGKGLAGLLSHPVLTYLGAISFPIFVLHGAIGQLCYKKIVATKLWGGVLPPSFFPAYCVIVLAAAAAVHRLFLENKRVQEISGGVTKALTKALS